MNFYTTSILALVSFYILLIIVVFFFQRSLLYHPTVNNYLEGQSMKEPVGIEKVKITTKDKIDLVAWFYNKNLEKFKTILFFHGNAGTLDNRTYKLNHFKNLNVNFLIIAWRGFSGNKGKPTERGLYKDAKSAVTWLNKIGVDDEKIIPANGVYAVRVKIENNWIKGMMNIGYRPTINTAKDELRKEVHIFNYNNDLYNKELIVKFHENIREEIKFSDINELKRQLQLDQKNALQLLS